MVRCERMATKKKRKQDRGPTGGGRFKRVNAQAPGRKISTTTGETLWTQELQDSIVRSIRNGNYAEVAARANGIAKNTFYQWLLRGGRGEEPFKALADAVADAAAAAEQWDVTNIARHAQQHWQASAWRLERRNPKRWSKREELALLDGDDKNAAARATKIDMSQLTDEERALFMKLREKIRVDAAAEVDDREEGERE